MSYQRPGPNITIATVAAGGSLPDVVDETSGAELAPLTVGIASATTGDTARALPTSCTLYLYAGPGETVAITGPVVVKGYHPVYGWQNLGYLFGGGAAPTVPDTKGHPADVSIPSGCTRLAVISEGAGPHVANGTLTIALEANIGVDHGSLP